MTNIVQTLRSSTPNTKPLVSTRQAGELWTNFPDLQLGLIDATQTSVPLIAVRYFSAATAYVGGDFAIQGGKLYVAKAAVPVGPFNASQWAALQTAADTSGLYLPLAGGTLSGGLAIVNPGTDHIKLSAPAGTSRDLKGFTGGVATANVRWAMELGDSVAESGSNAGSDFALTRYSDTGVFIDQPFRIGRSNGFATFTQIVTASAYNLNNAAGTYRSIQGQTAGVNRWALVLGDGTAEGGSNAGSNFYLSSFTDAGAPITGGTGLPALTINRASNGASFGSSVLAVNAIMIRPASGSQAPTFVGQDTSGNWNAQFVYSMTNGTVSMFNATVGSGAGQGQAWVGYGGEFQISSTNAFKPGGGAWAATSDARIKTVHGDYEAGLEAIVGLRPVRFNYKANDTLAADVNAVPATGPDFVKPRAVAAPYPASPHYNERDTEFVGFVAQEVEAIFPDLVTKRAGFIDGEAVTDLRSVDTTRLVYALVNAVKTLTARIQALEGAAAGNPA